MVVVDAVAEAFGGKVDGSSVWLHGFCKNYSIDEQRNDFNGISK